MSDEFMKKRVRTYYLEDAADRVNSDPDHVLKFVKTLKADIKRMKKEMGE